MAKRKNSYGAVVVHDSFKNDMFWGCFKRFITLNGYDYVDCRQDPDNFKIDGCRIDSRVERVVKDRSDPIYIVYQDLLMDYNSERSVLSIATTMSVTELLKDGKTVLRNHYNSTSPLSKFLKAKPKFRPRQTSYFDLDDDFARFMYAELQTRR